MKSTRNILLLALCMVILLIGCNPTVSILEDSATPPTQSAPTNLNPSTSPSVPTDSLSDEEGFTEMVLVNNGEILFKITAVENDPIWGYSLKVYIENHSDTELMFSLEDVTVNDYMCDPFWADSVTAGKKSVSSISWFESSFEEKGIIEVEEITFTLRVYDCNNLIGEDVFIENFTIHP